MPVLCDYLCIYFEILTLTVILSFDWLHCYTQCVLAKCRWSRHRADHTPTNDTTLYKHIKWTFMALDLGRKQSKFIWIGPALPNLRLSFVSRFRPAFPADDNSLNIAPNRVGSSQTWIIEVWSIWICWQNLPMMTLTLQIDHRSFTKKHCAKRPVYALRAVWTSDGVQQQQTVMIKLLGNYLSFDLCVDLKRNSIFKLEMWSLWTVWNCRWNHRNHPINWMRLQRPQFWRNVDGMDWSVWRTYWLPRWVIWMTTLDLEDAVFVQQSLNQMCVCKDWRWLL